MPEPARAAVLTPPAPQQLAGELAGPDRILTLLEIAAVLGGFAHLELRLFGRLGEMAPKAASPELCVWASAASMSAAWRAGQLAGLLPVSTGLPGTDEVTVSPGPLVDGVCEALDGAAVDEAFVTWMAAAVYPGLLAGYEARRATLSPAADGPVDQVLGRLVADVQSQLTITRGLLKDPGRGA